MRSRGFLRGCDLSRSSGCRETDSCGVLRGREEGEKRERRGRREGGGHGHEQRTRRGEKGAQDREKDREKDTRSSTRREGVKMAG